jgi:hypothetical protein
MGKKGVTMKHKIGDKFIDNTPDQIKYGIITHISDNQTYKTQVYLDKGEPISYGFEYSERYFDRHLSIIDNFPWEVNRQERKQYIKCIFTLDDFNAQFLTLKGKKLRWVDNGVKKDQVFVPLELDPNNQFSVNGLHVPDHIKEKSHLYIWKGDGYQGSIQFNKINGWHLKTDNSYCGYIVEGIWDGKNDNTHTDSQESNQKHEFNGPLEFRSLKLNKDYLE